MSNGVSRIDAQCIDLCREMNRIYGIETVSSCCGHGKSNFVIFFYVDSMKKLSKFLEILLDFWGQWTCEAYFNNVANRPIFHIEYMLGKGPRAYKAAQELAQNIKRYL